MAVLALCAIAVVALSASAPALARIAHRGDISIRHSRTRARPAEGRQRRGARPCEKHATTSHRTGRAARTHAKRAAGCRGLAGTRNRPAAQPKPVAAPAPAAASPVENPPAPTARLEAPLPTAAPSAPFRFFAATSPWNQPLASDAPLDPESTQVIGELDSAVEGEVAAKRGPWINTTEYGIPVYTVAADEPTVPVRLPANDPALASAWAAVPLPADAHPATGTDGILVTWQPSSDRLWEFWRLAHGSEGWEAAWGGAIDGVSANSGVFGAQSWPGAQTWWGASASSMSVVGGMISLEDLELGQIDHALSIAAPEVRAGVYSSPAQRSDGTDGSPLALPEGAHLRLNPNVDLEALHLPPLTSMLARAAQRYGIYVTDSSPVLEFYAQDPTPTGTNPYSGPNGYFGGARPSALLASFPWKDLELLKMELHSTH
jgi:hypothetical protein